MALFMADDLLEERFSFVREGKEALKDEFTPSAAPYCRIRRT
jgi:hypothetical protein